MTASKSTGWLLNSPWPSCRSAPGRMAMYSTYPSGPGSFSPPSRVAMYKKGRHTVWLEPAAWDMVEGHYHGDNCSTKNEYIEKESRKLRPFLFFCIKITSTAF